MERKELLLFARVDQKSWRFVGEVKLADPAFLMAKALDQNGFEREVIVFRLKPVSANFALLH